MSASKLDDLNEDLENYFANTIIPQLYVDGNLILRKFTPPAMKQFTLTEADINKHIEDVTDNIRYPTLIENINEVISTGDILEKEVQTTDKKWFQMNILPYKIRKENRTNGVILTFVDITKRIAVLNELERLNAENDTLLYTLTHDIRQPLSTVLLLADQLMEAYNSKDTEQFTTWVEMLTRASNNMRALLKEFTDHVHVESSLPNEEERVNIEDIFNDVILALRNEIYTNGIEIHTQFDTSEIIFSRKNLRSIVFNLLSNAIKYRRTDEALKIVIKTVKQEDYVLLSIKDNGLGIDKIHHKNIFDKFSRINPQIEGTGIGLYIVNRMLNDKGGKIEVESVIDEGSTFKVYFKSDY
ncbi:ATP-binding protein [Cryomorpha ignava]|uniref:histidine kinase n=1 Tax=Cryomorpha ignava TaxID=101383 RepID=A0A7K3WRB5_9FLAO|nr:ATP-binding protein [Cryomorpha ignava]NEN24217.1 ATP-binding protein [Cryomorpha ignava]